MRLVLIGCTGFVGRELIPQLLKAGHNLTVVSRNSPAPWLANLASEQNLMHLQINPADLQSWEKGILINPISKAEGIINLAGEPIAEKRWSPVHLKELQDSRLNTTKGLIKAIKRSKKGPRVVVNASAIGYYGTSLNAHFSESSPGGNDFLATLCQQWEALAGEKPRSTRLSILRIGIVLGPNGGALKKMIPVFKTGLGGPIGNGQQWMSWIHRTDLCQMIMQAVTQREWPTVVNAVSPYPVSMKEFATALGETLGRPSLLPVPGAILKLLLGDGARVVLEGQNVKSNGLSKVNFCFQYPELNRALEASIHTEKLINR